MCGWWWRRLPYRRRLRGTLLGTCWQSPRPSRSRPWRELEFLVCDAEMSSLDVHEGELLSLGWVLVREGRVAIGTGRHFLVSTARSVGQSAGIHQLRDCDLAEAEPEAVVLQRLCEAARGRVLVFHHAGLDLAYLDRASRRCFGAPLLLPWVDTLAIERRRQLQGNAHERGEIGLSLAACRRRYGLPDYPAHNALSDALATAELLLAIAAHRSSKKRPARLADLR